MIKYSLVGNKCKILLNAICRTPIHCILSTSICTHITNSHNKRGIKNTHFQVMHVPIVVVLIHVLTLQFKFKATVCKILPEFCQFCHLVVRFLIAALIRASPLSQACQCTAVACAHKPESLVHLLLCFCFFLFVCLFF